MATLKPISQRASVGSLSRSNCTWFPIRELMGVSVSATSTMTTPSTMAISENSTASARNWIASEARLAPRILRMPTDRARRVARAVARFM